MLVVGSMFLSPLLEQLEYMESVKLGYTYIYTDMFDSVSLSGMVTDAGTLGALIAVPIGIVAAFWGTRKVAALFKGFIK